MEGGGLGFDVGLVIGDHPEKTRPTVDRVNKELGFNVPFETVNAKLYPWREGETRERGITNLESERICELLEKHGEFSLVALLGYMRIVRGKFLEEWGGKIINTHPGKLPETADTHGDGASQKILDLGLPYTAHTVHLVTARVDEGSKLHETPVPVLTGDTADDLFQRVQIAEKAALPLIISAFMQKQKLERERL